MKKTLVKSLALAFAGSLLMAGSAMALPTLTLTDGFTTKTVSDNDGVTDFALDGIVTYFGTLGNWNVNVSTGASPWLPGPLPSMDVSSINRFADTAPLNLNQLTITLNDIITPSAGVSGGLAKAGGTNNGTTALFEVYYGATLMSQLGTYADPAYSGTDAFAYNGGETPITLVATLTSTRLNAGASFDFELGQPVPEPATMLLLGTGLAGLAGVCRRKAQK